MALLTPESVRKSSGQQGTETAKQLLATQIAATIAISLLFLAYSVEAAGSALLGSLIASLGLAWQALRFFRPYRASQPQALLAGMVMTEVFKLLFFGLSFALVFKSQQWIEHLPFLVGFIIVYLTPLIARLIRRSEESERY